MNSDLPENWDLVLELFQNHTMLTSRKNIYLILPEHKHTQANTSYHIISQAVYN